jgi:chromate reductase
MSVGSLVRILGISGSLRRASSNRAIIDAAARIALEGVTVIAYEQLDQLPPFNPDLDTEDPPVAVGRFREALATADAILLCSPEYAHGVSGVLKNALDWVVSSGEIIDKPVALINAAPRATIAHAALIETLTVMTARVMAQASIALPLQGTRADAATIATDARFAEPLAAALRALATAARL